MACSIPSSGSAAKMQPIGSARLSTSAASQRCGCGSKVTASPCWPRSQSRRQHVRSMPGLGRPRMMAQSGAPDACSRSPANSLIPRTERSWAENQAPAEKPVTPQPVAVRAICLVSTPERARRMMTWSLIGPAPRSREAGARRAAWSPAPADNAGRGRALRWSARSCYRVFRRPAQCPCRVSSPGRVSPHRAMLFSRFRRERPWAMNRRASGRTGGGAPARPAGRGPGARLGVRPRGRARVEVEVRSCAWR
jgi:hypothetical protein